MSDEVYSNEDYHDFVTESEALIDEVDTIIMNLESDPEGTTLNAVFRVFHNIKGMAGYLNLINLQDLAHQAENILADLREKSKAPTSDDVDLLYEALDLIRALVGKIEATHSDNHLPKKKKTILTKLKARYAELTGKAPQQNETETAPPPDTKQEPEPEKEGDETEATDPIISEDLVSKFYDELQENLEQCEDLLIKLEENPDDHTIVDHLLRNFHSLKGNAGFFELVTIETLAHETESIMEKIKSSQFRDIEQIITFILSIIDDIRNIAEKESKNEEVGLEVIPPILERFESMKQLVSKSSPSENLEEANTPAQEETPQEEEPELQMEETKPDNKSDAEEAPDKTETKAKEETEIEAKEETPKSTEKSDSPGKETDRKEKKTLRVDTIKLDHLLNVVGELVIAQAMVSQSPDIQKIELPEFEKSISYLEKICKRLQDMAMSLRLVPISESFRRIPRLVRDTAKKIDKKVHLEVSGEETEVDKSLIELINDPLVHMIRNAVDHGIETPEDRIAAGKPEMGNIWLSAQHEGGEVWITIKDDGKGLDKKSILAKAKKNGLIQPEEKLTDNEIYQLIFHPGFSTAAQVTDVSGRGVGMDVVKRNMDQMKGSINIHTELGKGTTFVLRVPLTMAIIDGMIVRVGDLKYVIPLNNVKQSYTLESLHFDAVGADKIVKIRDTVYPIVRLMDYFRLQSPEEETENPLLVMVAHEHRRCCVLVDEIVGTQQVVIKGLSQYLGQVKGVSGGTILGSGEVGMILDVGQIMN